MIRIPLVLFALALPFTAQISKHKDTDRVQLTDGKELKGRVVYEDDARILLREGKKKPREIARADVASVQSLERSLQELVDRYTAADKTDPEAMGEIARFGEERGLVTESKLAWVEAIFADSDYRPAYEGLNTRESSKKGWQFRVGKKWRTLEEAKAIHGKWKERWDIETTHFIIRTDLPVERLPRLAMNVERFYLDYYRLMRQALPLMVFDNLPIINLYVQEGVMPVPPVPSEAWFDLVRNELDVAVTEDHDLTLIMSEMTRLMLYNSLRGTIGQTGNTQPWCARGLADVFGSAVIDVDDVLQLDFDREYRDFFRLQAESESPLPLKRILAMGRADFLTGSNHELARAQAYTLTHFMVFGADEKYLPGFGAYLQSAYKGKGSESDLKKALELEDTAEFEAEWNAYVAAKAGG